MVPEATTFLEESFTVCVADEAITDGVGRWAQSDVDQLVECPNYWLPRHEMEASQADRNLLRGVGEVACQELWERVVKEKLEGVDWSGVEYWSQVYEGGRGLAFHFDKDERALQNKGEFRFPILSCVVYLTSTGRQAPTVVVDQVYPDPSAAEGGEEAEGEEPAASEPRRTVISYPTKNRALVFDGRLAHGVLDSLNKTQRKTLLVNFWAEQPEGLHRVSGEEMESYNLTPAPPAAAAPAPPQEEENGLEYKVISKGSLAEIPRINLGEHAGEMVIADDVYSRVSQGVSESGNPNLASHVVSVEHAHHVLYPIEAQDDPDVTTLGAFIKG